jgi:hypothetical protein
MNKLWEKEFGEHIAEKRGWHWALTSFMVEAMGDTESSKPNDWLKRYFNL